MSSLKPRALKVLNGERAKYLQFVRSNVSPIPVYVYTEKDDKLIKKELSCDCLAVNCSTGTTFPGQRRGERLPPPDEAFSVVPRMLFLDTKLRDAIFSGGANVHGVAMFNLPDQDFDPLYCLFGFYDYLTFQNENLHVGLIACLTGMNPILKGRCKTLAEKLGARSFHYCLCCCCC